MEIIKREKKICMCCMEKHIIKTVALREHTIFKNKEIAYDAQYMYCDAADEYYMDEQQIRDNDTRMKDAYRESEGLLTSTEISTIRAKYGISQTDLCTLLGWGGKTITRYESHQVQDKAHDSILKKIDNDPEWFLSLLQEAKGNLGNDAYQKYYSTATLLYEDNEDQYLRKAIEANYTKFCGKPLLQGNTELSLDKVVDTIRYFASSKKVVNLYKVKLMKLLWYADSLSYKKNGHAITGLVYQALPMGAVPVKYNSIINLKGVPYKEEDIGDYIAYHFYLEAKGTFPTLSDQDIAILDEVIDKLGKLTKDEIISFMHKEQAYINTAFKDYISFNYAEQLQI